MLETWLLTAALAAVALLECCSCTCCCCSCSSCICVVGAFIELETSLLIAALAEVAPLECRSSCCNSCRCIVGPSIVLETWLLIAALAAVALLECFRAVSAVISFTAWSDDTDVVVVGVLAAATSVSSFVQCSVQTVFVVDALRRVVRTTGQQRRKPGRTLVTFLLLANLSLFVVTLFEV